MKSIWIRIKTGISNLFKVEEKLDKRDFTSDLVAKFEEAKNKNLVLPFEIQSVKRGGFIVKVENTYGFVSFYHMPWKYQFVEQWKFVAKYLIGKHFFAVIHSVSQSKKRIKLVMNAKKHNFKTKELVVLQKYECVVMQRSRYDFTVDVGYHFGWKYGSITGTIHKSTFENANDLISIKLGDIITTKYQGKTQKGELIFGEKISENEVVNETIESFIGSTQQATLMKDKDGKRYFFIKDKYKTVVNVNPDIVAEHKKVRKKLGSLNVNSVIECKVLRISNKNNFVSEFLGFIK